MKFIDQVRENITNENVVSHGTKTPIAEGFSKQSLPVRLATPAVRAWDNFRKKDTGEEIQPKPVIGVNVLNVSMASLKELNDQQTDANGFSRIWSTLKNTFARKKGLESEHLLSVSKENAIEFDRVIASQDQKDKDKLVQGKTDSAKSSEDRFEGLDSLKELEVEGKMTLSVAVPVISEKKNGLVQKMKNMLINFFMRPFRATEVVDDNELRISSLAERQIENISYTPLEPAFYGSCREGEEAPPPSYEEAMAQQPKYQLSNSDIERIKKQIEQHTEV